MTERATLGDLTAKDVVNELIALVTSVEDCYEESEIGSQLIPALAVLKDHEIDGVGFELKVRFGFCYSCKKPRIAHLDGGACGEFRFGTCPDFSAAHNQRWWRSIMAARESLKSQDATFDSPYLLSNTGVILANLANAKTMMAPLALRFNCFTIRSFLSEPAPWGNQGEWTDADDALAAEWCQRQGLNIDIHTAAAAAESLARERTPHYHPVLEYLSALTWDGEPRCDRWLVDYIGCNDNPLTREMGAKWLIAAVKRVFEPRCQSDYTLVLEGAQGKRKSNALRELAGSDWFTDDIGDISDGKAAAEKLQGKWIVELSELDAFRRAEMTTVKAFLTRREDRFRPSFGRRAQDFPRQNVFAATTNREDWGMDDTGLRRFWPVKVGEIKTTAIAENRDRLWAEAVHRYREGEVCYLMGDMEQAAQAEQSIRQDNDAWESHVIEWIEAPSGEGVMSRPGKVVLHEILQHALSIPRKDWNPYQRQRLGRILRLNGYSAHRSPRCDDEGRRPEFWSR
jgi:hypothetical protein